MAEKIGILMEGDRGVVNGLATLNEDSLLTESQRPDYPMTKVTGLQDALDLKAVKTDVAEALALKADQEDMETALGLKADQSAMTDALALKANQTALTDVINKINGYKYIPDGAGPHNNVYRGISLGTSVTDAQHTALSSGKFTDMFIGDYWTISGITYRIAAFDYFYRSGDTETTTHHAVIVPDTGIGATKRMNETNITTTGYINSEMRLTNLAEATGIITKAFGERILKHKRLFVNAAVDGRPSAFAWVESTVDLMSEAMVYGCKMLGAMTAANALAYNHSVDKTQLPLFTFRPDLISNRISYWLQDVCTATYFAGVYAYGNASCNYASILYSVRPAFLIS